MTDEERTSPSFILCALTRDSSQYLEREIEQIDGIFPPDVSRTWIIVESDSSDNTVEILNSLSMRNHGLNFLSHGKLSTALPDKVERLAYCRNSYLDWINESGIRSEYVMVLDLDRLNNKLNWASIESVLKSSVTWDAAFPNQTKLYYDLFALRHNAWNPVDPFEYRDFLNALGYSDYLAGKIAVSSNMLHIPRHTEPIRVKSAFGGAAIYKRTVLRGMSYSSKDEFGSSFCEHVGLNLSLHRKGANLLIFPAFINAAWTEHTRKLRSSARFFAFLPRTLFLIINFLRVLFVSRLKNDEATPSIRNFF